MKSVRHICPDPTRLLCPLPAESEGEEAGWGHIAHRASQSQHATNTWACAFSSLSFFFFRFLVPISRKGNTVPCKLSISYGPRKTIVDKKK